MRKCMRDGKGRFATLKCVNAHDRCYGGAGGDCPYCEFTNKGIRREEMQIFMSRSNTGKSIIQ